MIKPLSILIAPALLLAACVQGGKAVDPVRYVDPFIGTAYTGHTHPCATTPFGMVQVGPDTGNRDWEHCSGYHDTDTLIYGFSHTHLSGTGCGDMGDIMILPVKGWVSFDEDAYKASFSHGSEVASPGYYKVVLDTYGVEAEMTATPRAGFHRYSFQAAPALMVDMEHGLSDRTTEGSERNGHQDAAFLPGQCEGAAGQGRSLHRQ